MSGIKVLVLVGSLRAASVNRQLAELAVESAPDGVSLQLFDRLGELPFYNEDIDLAPELGGVAEPVKALREVAADADAALVVTRSTTAAFRACSRTRSTGCLGPSAMAR
jgi:NAD(P)H-dependent FMN reductase